MTINPKGRIVDQIFFPRDRVVIKEECTCWGNGRLHWNLLVSDELGEFFVDTFSDESEIDWVLEKLREGVKNKRY